MKTETSTRIWRFGTAVIVTLSVVLVGAAGAYLAVANADLREQLSTAHADLVLTQENAERLYEQLLQEGVQPKAQDPSTITTGPTGATGARGPQGEPGVTPSPDEILDAITAYCFADNACSGPTGAQGASGPAGAAGSNGADGATGPQGPPGSAGPTCPDGYALTVLPVDTTDPSTGQTTQITAAICTPTP